MAAVQAEATAERRCRAVLSAPDDSSPVHLRVAGFTIQVTSTAQRSECGAGQRLVAVHRRRSAARRPDRGQRPHARRRRRRRVSLRLGRSMASLPPRRRLPVSVPSRRRSSRRPTRPRSSITTSRAGTSACIGRSLPTPRRSIPWNTRSTSCSSSASSVRDAASRSTDAASSMARTDICSSANRALERRPSRDCGRLSLTP